MESTLCRLIHIRHPLKLLHFFLQCLQTYFAALTFYLTEELL